MRNGSLKGPGGSQDTLPGFLLDLRRKPVPENINQDAPPFRRPHTWDRELYLEALHTSPLKKPVRRTLVAMLDSAGGGELTTVDRSTLCSLTGIRREATISEHWKMARHHGFLQSSARFNRSSLHRFILPGAEVLEDDWLRSSRVTPLRIHHWLPHEREWWEKVGSPEACEPPWGDGFPPF